MKKMTFIVGTLSFFLIASTAYAQAFVPLAPIPDLTAGATTNQEGLANFLNNLYKYAIGLAAALAVIQIVWAGLDIAVWHKDAVSTITNDKEKIYNALFGLILVLSPVLVFSIINPSILNLSLNLPELKTTTVLPTGTNLGVQAPAQDPELTGAISAGCTIITSTPQTLYCPDQASAQSFADACTAKGGTGNISSSLFSSKYQATCSLSASVACTTARSGQYIESAACASWLDTARYVCKNTNLTLRIPSHDCKSTTDVSGKCLDTSFNVYCTGGKSPVLTFYYYWNLTNTSKETIVPNQKTGFDSFITSCKNDGGIPEQVPVISTGKTQIECSTDSGIPSFSSTWRGARCFTYQLACNPPE